MAPLHLSLTLAALACLAGTGSALVMGPALQPTASLLASHRHAPPCAIDRVDRATAVRLGASAAAAGLAAAGVAPVMAAYPTLTIETTAGAMEFELWDDVAPAHVNSFRKLAQKGYFDGQAFHRVIPGFVIQGGDPNSKVGYGADGSLESGDKGAQRKWGTGGPGYQIKAEFNERKHEFGVLSMARSSDPNSAGSQFFVCLGPLTNLDNKYTVFGKVAHDPPACNSLHQLAPH